MVKNRGFTIVELLVVIVVIGILAAVTIIAYNGIQERARASNVSSALAQAAKKVSAFAVDNTDAYPATLSAAGIVDTATTNYQYSYDNGVSPKTFCITATTGTTSYKLASGGATPSIGGCPGHGTGGVAPITNMVANTSVGSVLTNWGTSTAGGANTQSRVTTGGPAGVVDTFHRTTITTTPTASPQQVYPISGNALAIPVSPSTTYTLSVYVRLSLALNAGPRIDANRYDSGGTFISTAQGTTQGNVVGTWTRITQTFTTTATTAYVQPVVAYSGPQNQTPGNTLDTTGFLLTTGSTVYTFADGNSPNWLWNGTVNNSSSYGPVL